MRLVRFDCFLVKRMFAMRGLGLVVLVLCSVVLAASARADGPRAHTRHMAATGTLGHDLSAGRAENVFFTSRSVLPRLQAIASWQQSPGHAANLRAAPLRMVLSSRVVRSGHGAYVTARGR
jgi:hypothetical protein